jgi:hypothetical protein
MSLIEYILTMWSELSEGFTYHKACHRSMIIYAGCDGTGPGRLAVTSLRAETTVRQRRKCSSRNFVSYNVGYVFLLASCDDLTNYTESIHRCSVT